MKKVFISYAKEDSDLAKKIYDDLKHAGVIPWMSGEDLSPGEKWKIRITQAIRESDYCLMLLSANSVSKRGYIQKEQKIATDVSEEYPDDQIFIIPVRIEPCKPINEVLQNLQWVDLFPSYEAGFEKILRSLEVPEQHSAPILSEISSSADALSAISGWKQVHHDAQNLFNSLNIPFELLIKCRYKPSPDFLDHAAEKWQGLCVPKLKSVSQKMGFQYPDHDIFDSLQKELANTDDITEKLRIIDPETGEIHSLYIRFATLKDTVFDVLTVADTKIMDLIESMRK